MYKSIKIILSFLLIILLIISINMFYVGATEENTNVKLGYVSGYGSVSNINSVFNKGYVYDITSKMEIYSDLKFEYIEYFNAVDMLKALGDGDIDIMGPNPYIEEDEQFKSSMRMGSAYVCLAVPTENSDEYYYDNPDSIDGKTVASFNDSPFEKYLDEYCEKHNITVNYVRGLSTDYENLSADLYLVSSSFDKFHNFSSIYNFSTYSNYMVQNKDNEQNNEIIDKAYENTIANEPQLLTELNEKYYGEISLLNRLLKLEEINLLKSSDYKVGFVDSHNPFTYLDENNNPSGISIDVFNYYIERYGYNSVQYIPYHLGDEDTTDEEYAYENCNVLLASMGNYSQLEDGFYLSDSYLDIPMFVLAENEIDLLDESKFKKVGVIQNATIDPEEIYAVYPNCEYILFTDAQELAYSYNDGSLDAVMLSKYSTSYAQPFITRDYNTYGTDLEMTLRLWISKDESVDYLNISNVAFNHIPDDKINEIIEQELLKNQKTYTLIDFLYDNFQTLVYIFVILALIAMSLIIFNKSRKKSIMLAALNKDTATNCVSQFRFNELVPKILKEAKVGEYEVVSIDLDKFSTINKVYGMSKGNEVIKAIAKVLLEVFDSETSVVARATADQFYLIHRYYENIDFMELCNKLIAPEVKRVVGENYNLSLSVGVYRIDDPKENVTEIFNHCMLARQKGKKLYKTTINYFDEQMREEEKNIINIVYRMKEALKGNEFFVKLQPKVDFKTLKICGAEALVRWLPKSSATEIYPDQFISVFESNGFIPDLDYFVFEETCKFINENSSMLNIPVISVNVSAITLFDYRFKDKLTTISKKYNINFDRVELEITESAIEIDKVMIQNKVSEIKQLGYSISIDDFGAGLSSLNRLSSLEFDTVKLDKEFLDFKSADTKGAIIVEDVVKMAKDIGMKVVCEGVETAKQAKWLQDINCDVAQGYYFFRPITKDEFIKLLIEDKTYEIE